MTEQGTFERRRGWSLRFAAALLSLCMAAVVHAADPVVDGLSRFAIATPAAKPGQSVTLLSDGRWLFAGGAEPGRPGLSLFTKEASGETSPAASSSLSAALIHPRFSHTATVLPDGTVLILGGVDANGTTVAAAEIFDPASGEITVVGDSGLLPRSHHAATLLTDGYVLITGGVGIDGKALPDAELWNPDTQRVEPLSNTLLVPRADHSAALLADGKGLVWGGQDGSGRPLANGEVYDPSLTRFSAVNPGDSSLPSASLRDAPPAMEASIPQANATDAAVDVRIAIRFSKYLQVRSVTAQAVTLVGPAGAVTGKVVAAGDGLLAFFTPQADLLPNATYTVFLRGLLDAQGQDLPWSAFKFTTRSLSAATVSNSGGSITINTPSTESPALAPPAAVERRAADKKKDDRKRTDEETQKTAADDDFEDWIPGEHHRHGQWRVLGTQNEPRTSKVLLRSAALKATARDATAISGRVARLNGLPLAGVTVRTGNVSTLTDAQGRFILAGVRAGAHEVTVDGSAVTSGGRRYATHFIRVEVSAKRTTDLDQPIYLARLNPANDIAIPSPADQDLVLTHPDIPGLEIHVPKGAVLRTRDGRIITKLNISPLPVDRVPFSVPEGFPVYFTIQPAGAFIDGSATGTAAGIRVIYPNYLNAPAGTRMTFWNYDPSGLGWQVYGRGTVSANGTQVVPDADVMQRNFMAFGYAFDNGEGPVSGEVPGGECEKGDPVDCGTGLFSHRVTDLYVSDTIPLALTRTYRPGDIRSRDFGIGTNHNYGLFLSNPTSNLTGMPPYVDLVLQDGGRVRFVRISGNSLGEAVYQHLSSPTPWMAATLRVNVPADRWAITTRDKTVYSFTAHSPNVLTGIQDRYGNAVVISRITEGGNIARVRSTNGRTLSFEYDAGNRITRVRDNLGRVVKYEYDLQGRLWKATDANGKLERYEYDALHRMTAVIDKRGNTMVVNSYDNNGRISQQTLADGAIWGFSYELDGLGRVMATTVTNPRGYVSKISFSETGYVTRVVDAVGQPEEQISVVSRAQTTNHRITLTDPLSRNTQYVRDHQGNMLSATRLYGTSGAVTTTFTYDAEFGNVESFTTALNHQTRFDYDQMGRLISTTDPLNHTTNMVHDAAGRPVAATTPLGQTTRLEYEQGDLSTMTDPLNRTSVIFTDAIGRTIGLRDPAGNRISHELDLMDRVVRSFAPNTATTTMTYDELGNLLTVRDARDLASHVFTYDARNRVETYTDPLGETEHYAYDGMGNLISVTDRKGQVTSYAYDPLERLTTITYSDSSTISTVWDAGNRRRQVIDSVNGTTTLTYDDLDRLTRELSPQGQIDYEYDNDGRRTRMTVAGRSPITYDYDDAGQLTKISQDGVVVNLAYDASGRRQAVTLPNDVIGSYGFDEADQLLSIAYDRGANRVAEVVYAYDLTGRRISQTGSLARLSVPNSVNSATYDAANRLTSWGVNSLSYDDNGNLSAFGATTYSWNGRNELISSSAGTSSFSYDAFGRRTARSVGGGPTTSYVYDGFNPVVVDSDIMLYGLNLDETYARVSATSVTSYMTDALRSTRALSDSSGAVTATYAYAPYGQSSKVGSDDTQFRFTGRDQDSATGLIYLRSRYYSPELSRFISEDAIGIDGGINLYGYGDFDPVSNSDPTGETPWGLIFATADLAYQLYQNDGKWQCVNWTDVGLSLLGGGLLNGVAKKAFRFKSTGKHTWDATKKWMRTRDIMNLKPNQHRHHWLFEQNQGIFKNVPDWVKNQPWNLNPISAEFNQFLGRYPNLAVLGAPSWAVEVATGTGTAIASDNCGC